MSISNLFNTNIVLQPTQENSIMKEKPVSSSIQLHQLFTKQPADPASVQPVMSAKAEPPAPVAIKPVIKVEPLFPDSQLNSLFFMPRPTVDQ